MVISSDILKQSPDVKHGFFTRRGGHSTGLYRTLNADKGSQEQTLAVLDNRQEIRSYYQTDPKHLPPLCTPHQIHSNIVHYVNENWDQNTPPQADALVTDRANIILGIVTADCAPLLFHDPINHIIGCTHAGWRGAYDGIIENTIEAMINIGAKRELIRAALGPTIAQPSYEVDQGFYDLFIKQDTTHNRFFKKGKMDTDKGGYHYYFNLPLYIMARLDSAHIQHKENLSLDTYVLEDQFFSYRRATHRGEEDYGRQITTIMMSSSKKI